MPLSISPRTTKRRLPLLICALALVATTVAACGGSSSSSTQPSSSSSGSAGSATTPKQGGTLTVVTSGESANLDPADQPISTTLAGVRESAIFGFLDYVDPTTGAIKMGFAKSITATDASDTVWNLVLQPGLVFSDGTPFDAAAVQYNITRMTDPTLGSPLAGAASALQMSVVNPTTLQFTLKSTNAHFPAIVSQDFPFIGSPTAEKADGKNFGQHPIGAGPFMFGSWIVGSKLTLVKNPTYYIKGEPYLDSLVYLTIADDAQEVNSMIAGTAQIMSASSAQDIAQLKSAGFNAATITISGGNAIYMNNSTPPFNNPIARQAITLALDRDSIIAASSPGSPPTKSIFSTSSPFFNSSLTWAATDHAKAQALFDQLAAAGTPLKFEMIVYASSFTEPIGKSVQSQLAGYKNVSVTVTNLLGGAFIQRYVGGTFQMANADIFMENPTPTLCDTFGTGGIGNYFKFSDPVVDSACASIQKTSDPTQNQKDYNTIMQELIKQNPVYLTGALQFTNVTAKTITNVVPVQYGEQPLWNLIGYKS
jgi:peptide/nickel transport system substrate-binding protein